MGLFKFYKREKLSDSEVQSLYAEGLSGPIASWDLNGNANDSTGNGNNGTTYNVTWDPATVGNQSYFAKFSGNGSVLMPATSALDSTSITALSWVKLSTIANPYNHHVVSRDTGGS